MAISKPIRCIMSDFRHTYLSFEYDMPCGHTMRHTLYNENTNALRDMQCATLLVPLVKDWVQYFERNHQCGQVCASRPNGC